MMQTLFDFYENYELITSEITVDGKRYTTYGIAGKRVSCRDVSVDKRKVLQMIAEINEAGLAECHLLDFIEDSLI